MSPADLNASNGAEAGRALPSETLPDAQHPEATEQQPGDPALLASLQGQEWDHPSPSSPIQCHWCASYWQGAELFAGDVLTWSSGQFFHQSQVQDV